MSEGVRILLVEDSAADSELVVRGLERDGLPVAWTRVEAEAEFRAALASFCPQLILADFSMPSFDGLDALAIARMLTPEVPFIFLSGTIGEERAVQGLKAGATDYVLKSNPARLPAAVRRALEEAELRRAQRRSEVRLRDISETSREWIWELDEARRFIFSSDAVRELLGVESETLIGHCQDEWLHPDDLQSMRQCMSELGPQRSSATAVVARWIAADGGQRCLERTIIARTDIDGNVVGYFGSDRDVTEQRVNAARIARMARVLKMQSDFSSVAIRAQRIEDLLAEACRLVTGTGGYRYAVVSRTDSRTRMAQAVASSGLSEAPGGISFPVVDDQAGPESITGRAIASGDPQLYVRPANERGAREVLESRLAEDAVAVVAMPLVVDGTAIGALTVGATQPEFLDWREMRLLRELADNLCFALRFHEKQATVHFLSYFDALTGLAKRALFCERLARSHADGTPVEQLASVLVFDVERLHSINDRFGRGMGDQLLQRIADRLKSRISNSEWAAHLGGGMFALAGPGEFLVRQVAWIFQRPFMIDGNEIQIGIRMGTATIDRSRFDPEALLQDAEAALLNAKAFNERVCEYTAALRSEIADSLALEYRLQHAMAENQFGVHYQPTIDLKTGRLRSVEALLRWNDPQKGLLTPVHFLGALEASGLIVDVGYWVMERAARDCRRWAAAGYPKLRVAVNLASEQLRRSDFVSRTLAIVTGPETSAPMDLEVTEGSLSGDFEDTAAKLRAIRAAGVRIAIDDFGTGYSSMSRLTELPIDVLKIDKSFVRNIGSASPSTNIISMIIGLAKALNMRTIAEGVETEEQLQLLQQLQCDETQGYLHCRPVPFDELLQWAATRHAATGATG